MAEVSHDGHRDRVRNRGIREGFGGFEDHELLEMLLTMMLPRRDTNALAHLLMDKFGSLTGVLDASPAQLMMVNGIGKVSAFGIALIKELCVRRKEGESKKISLAKLDSIIDYAEKLVSECYNERFVAVYLDHSTRYLYRETFDSNNNVQVALDIRQLITTAVRVRANGIIIFHCHVDGVCRPSEADMIFTEQLMTALASIDVVLIEHIIFNNREDYYSFYVNGDIAAMQKRYRDSH